VYTQGPVNTTAINAEKDTQINCCPFWVYMGLLVCCEESREGGKGKRRKKKEKTYLEHRIQRKSYYQDDHEFG
jgi:hypothetical protein